MKYRVWLAGYGIRDGAAKLRGASEGRQRARGGDRRRHGASWRGEVVATPHVCSARGRANAPAYAIGLVVCGVEIERACAARAPHPQERQAAGSAVCDERRV